MSWRSSLFPIDPLFQLQCFFELLNRTFKVSGETVKFDAALEYGLIEIYWNVGETILK